MPLEEAESVQSKRIPQPYPFGGLAEQPVAGSFCWTTALFTGASNVGTETSGAADGVTVTVWEAWLLPRFGSPATETEAALVTVVEAAAAGAATTSRIMTFAPAARLPRL